MAGGVRGGDDMTGEIGCGGSAPGEQAECPAVGLHSPRREDVRVEEGVQSRVP